MSQIFTGAKASITLGNIPILWAAGVQINQEMRYDETPELDTLTVAEYSESGFRVSATISVFKGNNQALADFGLDPADISDILTQPELILTVYNSDNDLPMYEMTGVKFKSGTGTVDSRGVWSGNWSFIGRTGRYL